MTKHILDRPNKTSDSALPRAMAFALKRQPHSATIALQRRNRLRNWKLREAEYLRCARQSQPS